MNKPKRHCQGRPAKGRVLCLVSFVPFAVPSVLLFPFTPPSAFG